MTKNLRKKKKKARQNPAFQKKNYFFFLATLPVATASLRFLPTLNLATLVAGTWIVLPVLGTLAVLAALLAVENVPKPMKLIVSPFVRISVIVAITASVAAVASFFVSPEPWATFEIKSALVIKAPLFEIKRADYSTFFFIKSRVFRTFCLKICKFFEI